MAMMNDDDDDYCFWQGLIILVPLGEMQTLKYQP